MKLYIVQVMVIGALLCVGSTASSSSIDSRKSDRQLTGLNLSMNMRSNLVVLEEKSEILGSHACLTGDIRHMSFENLHISSEEAKLTVKDQESCNASSAFAATSLLEHQVLDAFRVRQSLDEGTILNCGSNMTCKTAGTAFEALSFIKNKGGIMTRPEKQSDSCRYDPDKAINMKSLKVDICTTVEGELRSKFLKGLLETFGPVVVTIHVADDFHSYKGGVYQPKNKCPDRLLDLNHEVLLVGHGTDEETGTEYWLVQNSWGRNWGIKGFAKVAKGVCGIGKFITLAEIKA